MSSSTSVPPSPPSPLDHTPPTQPGVWGGVEGQGLVTCFLSRLSLSPLSLSHGSIFLSTYPGENQLDSHMDWTTQVQMP